MSASTVKSDLSGEYLNVFLLLVLYTLQGVPMGLGKVLPMILKERGASFSELGTFSLQSWPFSLKLLWAPLVDTVYVRQFGRRKTWMVPAQLLIGVIMLYTSTMLDDLLYTDRPAIMPLTMFFLSMNFFCATQDIAVDGWALTMLRKENAGYQAVCNAAGQTFGVALGFTGFTLLNQLKLLDLSGFMFCTGIVFITVTVAVAVLKPETPVPPEDEPDGVVEAYTHMFNILRLGPIQTTVAVLFTWKLAFAVVDSVAPLKFQEYGVPKEHMAYLGSILMPLEIVLPIIGARWASGPTPFNLALWVYPLRVAVVPITAVLAFYTPSMEPFPLMFWASMLAQMALFAKVSDPAIGGTYMTLLNTLANLGQKLPPTATFFLVDYMTCKAETCFVRADGFYVMTVVCSVAGIIWYVVGAGPSRRLQQQSLLTGGFATVMLSDASSRARRV
eukprot:CAMPEP_0117558818 /NCGR_PEP_ID=MMETSP0784-20121206/53039_1 /TAXON_ID=39447 /ORGANISM="" /LENGTH=444 /DNA_ID=CAMNT_0005356173 /DNA_START=18 /DNA_END=1350 /DNA_ORIENTATION=+